MILCRQKLITLNISQHSVLDESFNGVWFLFLYFQSSGYDFGFSSFSQFMTLNWYVILKCLGLVIETTDLSPTFLGLV